MKQSFTLFLIIAICTISNLSYSQSITEKLGSIKTDFYIYIDSTELTILNQIIIKRGQSKSDYGNCNSDNESYGYAYGVETFHLEFICKENFKIKSNNPFNRSKRRIEFYNEWNELIISKSISNIERISEKEDMNILSIDLKNIPIVILDYIQTIKIKNE